MKTGLCQCGCGAETPISKTNSTEKGWVKGQPKRFIHGHGKRLSDDKIQQRFWAKVDKGVGQESCWTWIGYIRPDRYGQFLTRRKMALAHRVAWEYVNGPIPEGAHLCHHCDNPPCVNPAHIFLGTPADNMRDSRNKDRHARGERNGHAKLTEDAVRDIRESAKRGTPRRDLCKRYGVSPAAIDSVIWRTHWKHI